MDRYEFRLAVGHGLVSTWIGVSLLALAVVIQIVLKRFASTEKEDKPMRKKARQVKLVFPSLLEIASGFMANPTVVTMVQ